ncbi:putative integrase/recombinase y4gC [Peptoclostridium acidaminophilum DSM 3953]|uniref:Putative integrase/recombinase y4gC n=1 Tax=Peptoclostridium acidaminophilum DSM 3953 TaxID=1286171 RepID=W8T8R3_PEPAC|nr:site-specific integrase [Peptoclostridium acidaminophilum]AHM57260.1 putative integrase/recombinase y4gC [Peptoclostridium acidaminophilum DSM 3953]
MNQQTPTQSPVQALVGALEAYLVTQNYTISTLQHYRRVWRELTCYADEKGIVTAEPEWMKQFLHEHYDISDGNALTRTQKTYYRAAGMLCDFQRYGYVLRRKHTKREIFPQRYQCIFEAAEKYCAQKRIAVRTQRQFSVHLRRFVSFLESRNLRIETVEASHMREYFLTLETLAKSTVSFDLYVLRSVLPLLFADGVTSSNLSLLCPSMRIPAGAKIPSAYSPEDIQAILDAVDRENPQGKRDYAILLIAARLGLRVGDIRELRFENIRWDAGEIHFVQSKTSNEIVLPLSDELGWALIDYVKNGRPITDSKVIFVRHIAPYDAFGKDNNMNSIISKYFKIAKIHVPPGKRHGMHVFRHSLASSMLANGTPLPVVSEALGHNETNTTARYLKIAVEQLRGCALEVNV